ncbi:MAG: hypothetical protein D6770_09140 [Anaerolineae bacterium]|nr:MAG: hypothetical protein D6770_09140 [Anaerolineae bacterium]
MRERRNVKTMVRKFLIALSILALLYLGVGLAFHINWERAQEACRQERRARGEFVEPEVFGGFLGAFFDITNWPVYAWANVSHDGTPFATPCTHAADEQTSGDAARVSDVVTAFGKRLQNVSLSSPNAPQDIEAQYAGFVSPDLLALWMDDPSGAPGRLTSSPWPDRIEIISLEQEGADRYVVRGDIVEVTGADLANGGAANRIPVRLVVERRHGRWVITEFTETSPDSTN